MSARRFASVRRRLDRWLFRIGRPEPAPIVLGQRRIFVLPTPAGLAYAAALAVMLVASINYNLSLGYGLVFLLAGIGIASIVHAFRNLLHLALRPGRTEPVFAGETAAFRLLVANPRPRPRPALHLRADGAATAFELAAEDTAEVVVRRASSRRGWLPVGRVVIETAYPLGLIRAWSIVVPAQRCLVYPAPEPAPPPLPAGRADGIGGRSLRTGDDDFTGLRAHRPSDSPRHVAWKILARGGPMLTKEFAGLDGGEVHLDWHALPADLGGEARLARLAAWVLAAEQHQRRFALTLPDGTTAADRGPRHVAACLERLALFDCRASADA